MKLKELILDALGTELTIKTGAVEKIQEKNPGALVTVADYLTPEVKQKKIKHVSEL